ncbi:hypothetical protein LPW36_01840 [Jinshanibacter sp. LJY008]|uniref:Uncharacterized protein n=1 Tax=Limnobaculum eriocheiris TaxID=2897391 RepID=A0A9X1MV72_9GAMM|nr:hypothetical protein [Limnobaculum eriocheiris]
MNNHVVKSDIFWGYLSQFLNMGSYLILLPIALYYLNEEQMGLWYVFLSIAGVTQLLEFGFQPTISRHTSYIYSGAKKLSSVGIPDRNCSGDEINIKLLANFILASRKVYFIVSIAASIILLIIGTLYIYSLNSNIDSHTIFFSWVLYSISNVTLFYFGYYNGILKGRGDQTALNKVIVISKVTNIVVVIPLLVFGFGIMALSIGMLCSVIVDRFLISRAFYNDRYNETKLAISTVITENLLSLIWTSSWRLGFVQLGSFLILRANLFIASSFLGLAAAASYGLATQLLSVLIIVASMYFGLQLPHMNSLQFTNSKDKIKKIFSISLVIAWFIFIFGFLCLIYIGIPLINLVSSGTKLFELKYLVLFFLAGFLEMNHSLCTAYLTTLNRVPFMWSTIISGILIVFFSLISIKFLGYGIGTLVISLFIVQVCFNNWFWPVIAYNNLGLTFFEPFKIAYLSLSGALTNSKKV